MKWKVMLAAVIGLMAAALTPLPPSGGGYTSLPIAQLAGSMAGQQQAATQTPSAVQPQTESGLRFAPGQNQRFAFTFGQRWHHRRLHLPRPPRHRPTPTPSAPGSPAPTPSGSPQPTPSGSPQPTPSGSPRPTPSGSPSPTPSGSPSPTPSGSPRPTPSGSPQPTPSASPSQSPNPSPSPSMDPQPQVFNCALIVPANPLSARGLATPWQLTDDGAGPCHEANSDDAAFLEAAILDPATGQVSVYDPLVVDRGSRPVIAPVVPTLPANAVVAIWAGYNGDNLTIRGPGASSCVSGVDGSDFGQNIFCNAGPFFEAANQAIAAGKLVPPALGTGKDGKTCPTVRDFSVVDQDQSDNTTTTYLVTADGRMAQDTPANRAQLTGASVATNGSDEGLLNRAIASALGCANWTAPNLADKTGKQLSTAWPLNELMASVRQAPPVALVPAGDPMVFVGDNPDLAKLNAYRTGVNMATVRSLAQADTKAYCQNLLRTGLARIAADRQLTQAAPSPFPADASNLFNFLALRFNQTFSNDDGFLHCEQLLNLRNPVTLQMTDGVVTGATITLNPAPASQARQPAASNNR